MKRLGFCFLDRPSVGKQIDLVRKIENLGYESAWVTETRLARDAFSVLGAFAAVTKRVKLATGIVNTWTRGPALMAMTLATLDEMAPGRVICGLGAYWDPLAWKQGIERRKPARTMAHSDAQKNAAVQKKRIRGSRTLKSRSGSKKLWRK